MKPLLVKIILNFRVLNANSSVLVIHTAEIFIFIQYLRCLALRSVYIVFEDETSPDIFGLQNYIFEYLLTFQIFQISEQRKKMPGII